MAYSSIIRKKCKCNPNCDKWPTLGYAGYFSNHSPQEIKDKVGTKKKVAQKNRNKRTLLSRKLHIAQNEIHKLTLNEWFNDIAVKNLREEFYGIGCNCSECGAWIDEKFIRHATAHLLPKKIFKSQATHELNYLILGAGCGCHSKTDRLDLFVTMKMWPEAARRIKIMMPLLPFEELQYISSQFLAELDKVK